MKLKTRRGAAKRFKKTGNGIKRKQAFKRHILTKNLLSVSVNYVDANWYTCLMRNVFTVCVLTYNL